MKDKKLKSKANDAVRTFLIEEYDDSPDGKLEKLINALHFDLMFGPRSIDDVREEIGEFFPGWYTGCDILSIFLSEMPKVLWVDMSGEPVVFESQPDQYFKCDECGGKGEINGDWCDACEGEGIREAYLEDTFEIDTATALLGDLKGYTGHSTEKARHIVSKYWRLPNWKVKRLKATERRINKLAIRKHGNKKTNQEATTGTLGVHHSSISQLPR